MTNQEASKVIKDGLEDMSLDFADEEQYEALTMAIKALEQEPSGDAISRDKVHEIIAVALSEYITDEERETLETLDVDVANIPTVQYPKTGRWIERRNRATGRIESVCSECGAEEGYPYNIYCGNCGCRMFEPKDKDIIWYDKRNYSEIVVKPQEERDKE